VPKRRKVSKEPFGYQPNNPLTIYFKKRIEKEEQPKKSSLRHAQTSRHSEDSQKF
tara:strand:- start:69 stop:233 length:165 start_codon:yes stop_codon:yes gene_type:complete